MCLCINIHTVCVDKFVQECGVARLWEVACGSRQFPGPGMLRWRAQPDMDFRQLTELGTLYFVLSGVTIEAETGMTIYVQCWVQVRSAHCSSPLNICKVCVCIGDVLQLTL